MSLLSRNLAFATAFLAYVGMAYGDIQLSVQSGGSWVENSGVQTLQLLANSNSSDQLITLTADVQLSGGSFTPTPGTYGQAGFIGVGNLDLASDFQRDPGNLGLANLSLEFTFDQLFTNSNQTLATLSFNINGLAPGDYDISFPMLDAQSIGGAVGISGTLGSFTITAVPEPATMMPTLILGSTGVLQWRRRRRKKRQ